MPPSLLGNDVNLEESRAKRWQEAVGGLLTSLQTLDPAIPKAPTTRQLAREDSEAQRGDQNHPRSCHQKQALEPEPRSFDCTSRTLSLVVSVSPSPHGHGQVCKGLQTDRPGRQKAIP